MQLAPELTKAYQDCQSAHLVAGFMTVEGIDALLGPMRAKPDKLSTMVVGAATWRALDAYDQLLAAGASPAALKVHLGHTRPTGSTAKYSFYRYHPMLHSKVYLFDKTGGRSVAFIGSHNLTGFALNGLNGEAAVKLEGPSDHPSMADIRQHIESASAEAIAYDPGQRDAYAWWSLQFAEGLKDKFRDTPSEDEIKRTIVIVAEASSTPRKNSKIYFEIPEAIGQIRSLRAEVHLFLFDQLPPTPQAALASLSSARASVWCKIIGIEDDQGGKELKAEWYIDPATSQLRRAPSPFRPTARPGMQQVRAQAYWPVKDDYEYFFDAGRFVFEPTFGEEAIEYPQDRVASLAALDLVPPEHKPWFPVIGLKRKVEDLDENFMAAVKMLSPESGSFMMMSLRRRPKQ